MSALPPVLILGGASDIGLAVARRFAAAGHPVQLAARRPGELKPEASDITLRYGVGVSLHRYDALERDGAERLFDELPILPGIVVSAVGLLGDQAEAECNPEAAALIVESNFTGPMISLEIAARRLIAAGRPAAIIGIGSVAGDRGRAVNYWYGASKAGFAEALSGLRQRLHGSPVAVLTVKPGFVATRMTEGMATPARLTASARAIAELVWQSWRRGRPVAYPFPWRLVMGLIRLIPEPLFARLKF